MPFNSLFLTTMNPYASPTRKGEYGVLPIEFDGELLIVEPNTVLPGVCVLSGNPIEPSQLTWRRLSTSIWGDVRQRSCYLYYGLAPQHQSRYTRRKWFIRLYQLAMLLTFGASLTYLEWELIKGWLSFVLVPLCFLNVIVLSIPTEPLSIGRYRKGRYWIRGISNAARSVVDDAMIAAKSSEFKVEGTEFSANDR